jgi:hypothetical protein
VPPRRLPFVVLTAVALVVGGCGSNEEAVTTEDPGEIAFELETDGERNATGVRATLTFESRDETTIVVDGFDESEPAGGGPNPVSLRRGSCDDPQEVVFELESMSGSTSETVVEIGIPALLNGDYSIAIGLAPGQPDVIACGDVPDEAPSTS